MSYRKFEYFPYSHVMCNVPKPNRTKLTKYYKFKFKTSHFEFSRRQMELYIYFPATLYNLQELKDSGPAIKPACENELKSCTTIKHFILHYCSRTK